MVNANQKLFCVYLNEPNSFFLPIIINHISTNTDSKIYWTDWNYFNPKIEVADMSGRNRRVLLDREHVRQPNTLTMDYMRRRLCWTDYRFSHVACMVLDGKKKVEIISREVGFIIY